MAKWNDLPFEIKSHIFRHLILAEVQHRAKLHKEREAGRVGSWWPLWPRKKAIWLPNLLDAVPDMYLESKKIVSHLTQELKKKHAGGNIIEEPPQRCKARAIWTEYIILLWLALALDRELRRR